MPLHVSAISFLNPAPLLYNFEHEPVASELARDYALHYTTPSACAEELLDGSADLGLIPIASLTPALAIVPGCTIASVGRVRSILLLVKNAERSSAAEALKRVRSVATDAASRSSQAYVRILFEHFHGTRPGYREQVASEGNSVERMLEEADAALLIGDPALLAREQRERIDAEHGALLWLDVAELWMERTGLPWVAAVWAVRPEALGRDGNPDAAKLIADAAASRDAGLAHIPQLVEEWRPRLALAPATIHEYLSKNIYYTLDAKCVEAIVLFRKLAAEIGALPELPELTMLG